MIDIAGLDHSYGHAGDLHGLVGGKHDAALRCQRHHHQFEPVGQQTSGGIVLRQIAAIAIKADLIKKGDVEVAKALVGAVLQVVDVEVIGYFGTASAAIIDNGEAVHGATAEQVEFDGCGINQLGLGQHLQLRRGDVDMGDTHGGDEYGMLVTYQKNHTFGVG